MATSNSAKNSPSSNTSMKGPRDPSSRYRIQRRRSGEASRYLSLHSTECPGSSWGALYPLLHCETGNPSLGDHTSASSQPGHCRDHRNRASASSIRLSPWHQTAREEGMRSLPRSRAIWGDDCWPCLMKVLQNHMEPDRGLVADVRNRGFCLSGKQHLKLCKLRTTWSNCRKGYWEEGAGRWTFGAKAWSRATSEEWLCPNCGAGEKKAYLLNEQNARDFRSFFSLHGRATWPKRKVIWKAE